MDFLKELFAVTITESIYRIFCEGPNFIGRAEKIFPPGKVKRPLMLKMKDFAEENDYIGIGDHICMYYDPKKRSADKVSTKFWGGYTSEVVALFLDEDSAKRCVGSENLNSRDPRWLDKTEEAKQAIGDNHPRFVLGTKWKLKNRKGAE